MPTKVTNSYTQASLNAYKFADLVRMDDFDVSANEVIALGAVVAQLTGVNANDVQTLTNTATGGTFTLTFGNTVTYTTTALTCTTLTAAQLQTALQALPNIGAGNCTVTGGPFSSGAGSLVVTFNGALANNRQTLMVINNGSATGGSVTIAHTTTGNRQGAIVNYNGTLVANPTTAMTLGAAGADGTLAAGTYSLTYTKVTAAGESLPNYPATIAISATNHIAVTSITGMEASVTAVNVYINGVFAVQQAVASGATGGFNILAYSSGSGKAAPTVSTAYVNSNGSQIPIGAAWYPAASAPNGVITYGPVASGNEFQPSLYTVPVALQGYFKTGDLSINGVAGVDATTVAALGKLVRGTLTNGVLVITGA